MLLDGKGFLRNILYTHIYTYIYICMVSSFGTMGQIRSIHQASGLGLKVKGGLMQALPRFPCLPGAISCAALQSQELLSRTCPEPLFCSLPIFMFISHAYHSEGLSLLTITMDPAALPPPTTAPLLTYTVVSQNKGKLYIDLKILQYLLWGPPKKYP